MISGIPRSGTTWVSSVLDHNNPLRYIHEPDNSRHNYLGFIYKRKLHRFPFLRSEDKNDNYLKLFNNAFKGYYFDQTHLLPQLLDRSFNITKSYREQRIIINSFNKNENQLHEIDYQKLEKLYKLLTRVYAFKKKQPVIVKSVHNILALDFIYKNFKPKMIIILRHPANIISSYLELNLNDAWRNIFTQKKLVKTYFENYLEEILGLDNKLKKFAAQISAFYYALEKQLKKNPEWFVITHEELIADPIMNFRLIYKKLSLPWSQETEHYIQSLNKEGYGFSITRDIEQLRDKYKTRLDKIQIDQIREGYHIFPVKFYRNF